MSKQIYVDGFLLTVKKDRIAEYKKIATAMAKLCKQFGALSYVEAMADDLSGHAWPHADFAKMAKAKDDEVVFFSYITYPNKKARIKANKLIDAEMQKQMKENPQAKNQSMPFDMKKMAYGGFQSVVMF